MGSESGYGRKFQQSKDSVKGNEEPDLPSLEESDCLQSLLDIRNFII